MKTADREPPAGPAGPAARDYLAAGAGFVRGMARPRRPDRRLLDSIADAGLPEGERTVTVRALPQVSRAVPAGGIVEGAGLRRSLRNAMTTFVVEHPDALFLVDPAYCREAPARALAEIPGLLRRLVTPPPATIATVDALASAPLPRIVARIGAIASAAPGVTTVSPRAIRRNNRQRSIRCSPPNSSRRERSRCRGSG